MKFIAVIIILSFLLSPAYAQDNKAYIATVERVIDGDTLLFDNGENAKLIGISCPKADTEEGKKATEFVKRLIEGKKVHLEYDVQQRDKNGRLLVYILIYWHFGGHEKYMVDSNGPKNLVNAYIVNQGYASPVSVPPNVKYADLFQKLYREARENKRGLWKDIRIGASCQSPDDCVDIDCSLYDNPIKSGYKPDCVKGICKCMCYRCH